MKHIYLLRRLFAASLLLMFTTLSWARAVKIVNEGSDYGFWYLLTDEGLVVTYPDNDENGYNNEYDFSAEWDQRMAAGDALSQAINDFVKTEFYDKGYTSVEIPATVNYYGQSFPVVGIDERAFWNCQYIKRLILPEGIKRIGALAFCRSHIEDINIPTSVTFIGRDLFDIDQAWGGAYGHNLTTVRFGSAESIFRIEYENFNSNPFSAFHYGKKDYIKIFIANELCSTLVVPESIDRIPDFALAMCPFEEVILHDGVTSIGKEAFASTPSTDLRFLHSINIPSSVTSIGDGAFQYNRALSSISLSEGLTSIGSYAFLECPLTSISIPESVTSIGSYAFVACSSLTSVSIPKGVTSIEDGVFRSCTSLTSISIPKGVTSIGDAAFQHCRVLPSISIPEGVTSIGDNAFWGCWSLKSVGIPSSVNRIGQGAFFQCEALEYFVCLGENPPTIGYNQSGPFGTYNNNANTYDAVLYVPASALEAYSKSNWNEPFTQNDKQIKTLDDMKVTISVGAEGLATYSPPIKYNVDFTDAKNIAAYRAVVEGNVVKLHKVTKVAAGEGVLLRSLNEGETSEILPFNVTTMEREPNNFVGVINSMQLSPETEDGNYLNYVLSKKDDVVGFYKPVFVGIDAGKAYLRVPANSATAEAKGLKLVFDDDNVTGIDIVETQPEAADDAYYTLSGVRVENPTQKGIYIKNGKKYIVK